MFNPFYPFTEPLLHAFVKAGKKYFVRQLYSRTNDGPQEGVKGLFIFTHYAEIGHAQHHFGAISQDPYKYLYEWDSPDDRQRLIAASRNPAGFKIYSAVFRTDWQSQITHPLKEQVRKYIDAKLAWKPGGGETVGFEIYASYGELYAKLKLKNQQTRVKLEEIERY